MILWLISFHFSFSMTFSTLSIARFITRNFHKHYERVDMQTHKIICEYRNEIYIYIINIWIIGLSLAFLLFCSNKQHIQGCGAHHLITMFQTFYTQTNFILHYWLRFRYHVPSLCLQQTTWIIDLCGFEDSLIKQISHTIHIVWKLINPIYKRGGNNSV